MTRRKKSDYFDLPDNAPKPIAASIVRRCQFSEVDALAIAWHGRYASFFEEAAAELGLRCGLTYEAMRKSGIAAPIAQLHIDYHRPLKLNERFTVQASFIWCEAAKLNTQFLITAEDGLCACTGYTVQMFVEVKTGNVCIFPPPLLTAFRDKWLTGEFYE
ncbi:MAG: acyl-CoA thioesterase [Lentisphaerota bacterium]